MIGNIVLFLISFFAICIMLYLAYRAIKKSNSLAEKISEIVLAMVMAIILVIYYLKTTYANDISEYRLVINKANKFFV